MRPGQPERPERPPRKILIVEDDAAGPPPDLILLAVFMPVMDGWQFLDRLWAIDHGCEGFLRKPFEGDEVAGRAGLT